MVKLKDNTTTPAELENISTDSHSSFHIGRYENAFFSRPWHYHPEYELLLVTKGYGTRMVGDHFEPFKENDLVLLGGNLPHAWISDPKFISESNTENCESIFIQFRKKVFGSQFIDIPELESVRIILKKAERGIKIIGSQKEKIIQEIKNISKATPLEQLLSLIKMLDWIQHAEYEILASDNFAKRQFSFKSTKMREVHNYIMKNFKEEIDIDTCAEYIKMTPSSFCRFFKKNTNVTFSIYLNYVRINFAQKLIINTQMPIKEIAFECGFSSVPYFNQKFKKVTGLSPNGLRKKTGLQ